MRFSLQSLRRACSPDIALYARLVSITDRGLGHKVKHLSRKLAISVRTLANWQPGKEPGLSSILPGMAAAARRMVGYYLDVIKDVALIIMLRYMSEWVFRGHFDTIGAVNLDYIA